MSVQQFNYDSHIEDFNLIKKIGSGAYGEVWLAEYKVDNNRKCVLKRIPLLNVPEKERKAAQQESRLLFQLKHPNIVQYKASFEHNSALYIAMAYCEDGDLYTKLKHRLGQPLDERQLVEWFVQITMALQYLHSRNILHRDLKTQNIFLTKSKIIKVGDLGIARILDGPNSMATTMIGTPYYMSPELFSRKPYNHKSDVWALGCCVYEMATLKHAFNARDFSALSYKIMRGKLPDMPSQYSPELLDLIRSMLNKDADKRPSVNRILRDPYVRKNIQIFLEGAKHSTPHRCRPKTAASDSGILPQLPRRESPALSNDRQANNQIPIRPRSAKERRRRDAQDIVSDAPVNNPVQDRTPSNDQHNDLDNPQTPSVSKQHSEECSKTPIRSKSPCGNVQPTELEKQIAKHPRFQPNSESTSSNEENHSAEASGDTPNHQDYKKKTRLNSPQNLLEKENGQDESRGESSVPEKLHNASARKERRQKRARGLLPGLMLRNQHTPEKMEHVKQIVLVQKRNHNDLSEIINSPLDPPQLKPKEQDSHEYKRNRNKSDGSSDVKGKENEESEIRSVIQCMNETLTFQRRRLSQSEETAPSEPSSHIRVRKASDSFDDAGPVENQEDTFARNTLVEKRMTELHKDLVTNLGIKKLQAAYQIFSENIDEMEFEPKLRAVMKDDAEYNEYAQKIWQFKYWEDCRIQQQLH